MCEVSEEKYNSDVAQLKEKIANLEKQIEDSGVKEKAAYETIA